MQVVVFDIEANGLLDEVDTIHCGVFTDLESKETIKFRPHQMKEMVSYMSSVDVLIGHNIIGYDLPVLKKVLGFVPKAKIVDTLIMSRLLNPKRALPPNAINRRAGPHSLYAWGVRVGVDKPDHEDWETFSEDMMHRCTEDVRINVEVYYELLKEAKGGNWKNAFLLTFKLFENLQKQEEYGWKVDVEYMKKSISILENWIRRIDKALAPRLPLILEVNESKVRGEYNYIKKPFKKSGEASASTIEFYNSIGRHSSSGIVAGVFSRISFRSVDLDSNMETKDFLLNLGWEPLEWNTNDAGEKTSPKLSKDDPFEGIEGKLGRLVAKRVQCRHRKSSLEGLLALVRADGCIPSVIHNLAVTGRAIHRNIVNIPAAKSFFGKQMRKVFSTREGMVLVGTDSDSCQVRMLAARMGSKTYIDAIVSGKKEDGTDNHSLTQKICGLDSRDTAKTVLYCLLFGGGDTKLGKSAKMPGQGPEIRRKLYQGFDGLEELVEKLTREWKATAKKRYNSKWGKMEYYDGCITGLDGRPIRVPYEHQLLVYLLQSDEAIMMAAAYNIASKRLAAKYDYGKDYGFVCWMHDEYTVECIPEIAKDVKKICEKAIVDAAKFFKLKCPHIGDGQIGNNWYEIH